MKWDIETIGLIIRTSFLVVGLILLVIAFFRFRKSEYFPKLINRLDGMFTEKDSKSLWSSRRFAYLFPIFLSNIVIWGALFFIIIITSQIPDIPEKVIWLYGVANGIASTVATLHRKFDKGGNNNEKVD